MFKSFQCKASLFSGIYVHMNMCAGHEWWFDNDFEMIEDDIGSGGQVEVCLG